MAIGAVKKTVVEEAIKEATMMARGKMINYSKENIINITTSYVENIAIVSIYYWVNIK